jgi:predicted RNA-binding Zn-ribbon protein involved in translation (DUF1610 family)
MNVGGLRKMTSKCPKCGEEIEKLINCQSGIKVWEMGVDCKGFADYTSPFNDFFPDDKENRWECPECGHTITNSEEEAVKFLKGNN